MKFFCPNKSCEIFLSNAIFPIATICPLCRSTLEMIEEKIDDVDWQLLNSLPYTIAYPLKQALSEKHYWSKINYLKDTFLNYLKYLGLIVASEFFNSELKNKGMVLLFQNNLMETSFGKWNHFIRECLFYLKSEKHKFFCPEIFEYYNLIEVNKNSKKFKGEIEWVDEFGDIQIKINNGISGIAMLINFRNRYLGHGLTLNEEASLKVWNLYFPILKELLSKLTFPINYPMLKKENGITYLLQSPEVKVTESSILNDSNVWIQKSNGNIFNILPFFVAPSQLSMSSIEKYKLLTYEAFTGKTIKFNSPEGSEIQTNGSLLWKLKFLLQDKQRENLFNPHSFSKDVFKNQIVKENANIIDILISEKKIFPDIYQKRDELEGKLLEWVGSKFCIFFIAAEAGSGKTNLLFEIHKQYLDIGFLSLFIRAGRMDRFSLREQIAYLLNLNMDYGLENYLAIPGTQLKPSFIIIDGLNEAINSETIWNEILELCTIFKTGSLKIIVSARITTKLELSQYKISDNQSKFFYTGKRETKIAVNDILHWLPPFDMNEMRGAWQKYIKKEKTKFKPKFSFEDIAHFDRRIYSQINNPLVLRIFLGLYNGKVISNEASKNINIWKDWFLGFSQQEQIFIKLLSSEIWNIGTNEILLDDLLENEVLKNFFILDIINSPYNRLRNNGVISCYIKNLTIHISFTVEGFLFYLLGQKLFENKKYHNINSLLLIIDKGNNLQKAALDSFLSDLASNGSIELVVELIDAGKDVIPFCLKSIFIYLQLNGINDTIELLLKVSSFNRWLVIRKLDNYLGELHLYKIRREFLSFLKSFNLFENKDALWLGLKTVMLLDKKEVDVIFNDIEFKLLSYENEPDILLEFGHCLYKFGYYDKALNYYEKSLNLYIKNLKENYISISNLLENIGLIKISKGEYEVALTYYLKSLKIRLKFLGSKNLLVANLYSSIGSAWRTLGEYEKAIGFYKKSLSLTKMLVGTEHPAVARAYSKIGRVLESYGDYKMAFSYFERGLKIQVNLFGINHIEVATSYSNIGSIYRSYGDYSKALEFQELALNIKLKILGHNHPSLLADYNNIGGTLSSKGCLIEAIRFFKRSLRIQVKALGDKHPSLAAIYYNIGTSFKNLGNYRKAIEYYIKTKDIQVSVFGASHTHVASTYSDLGELYDRIGNVTKAREYYKLGLTIQLKYLN